MSVGDPSSRIIVMPMGLGGPECPPEMTGPPHGVNRGGHPSPYLIWIHVTKEN